MSNMPLFDQAQERKVYSVSQLNREIRSLLEGQFRHIWLEGEISNFKHHSSGHMYLSLKDEKSQVSAVFFSRSNQLLKFRPKDGLKVLVMGRISLYEPRGNYQVYIDRMEPQGMGALQLAFLQMKEKLAGEGLFDADQKKTIPRFPKKVGFVTSPTSAAIRDLLQVITRRWKGAQILIYPARVQGEGAAEEVAAGIAMMNKLAEVDVLIVGRGGGSLEDLWAFNEEIVARAIFASKIPIISAVGHEIDWTISDLVADLRAPTPSAAAELVVQNHEEVLQRLFDLRARMAHAAKRQLNETRNHLESLASSYAFSQPRVLLEQFSQRVDECIKQLRQGTKVILQEKKHELQALAGQLNALSPLAILERGYSLTLNEKGDLVRTKKDVKKGDVLVTKLTKGEIKSRVE